MENRKIIFICEHSSTFMGFNSRYCKITSTKPQRDTNNVLFIYFRNSRTIFNSYSSRKIKSLKSYTKRLFPHCLYGHTRLFLYSFFTRSFKVCTRSRSLHFELFMADNGSYFRHTNSERKLGVKKF